MALDIKKIGLVVETYSGEIIQIACTEEQMEQIHYVMAFVSSNKPFVVLPKEHNLVLKSKICKRCLTKIEKQ